MVNDQTGAEGGRSLAGRALGLVIGASVAAAVAQGVLYQSSEGAAVRLDLVVPMVILIIGGILAGWSLPLERTVRPVLASIVIPLVVTVPVFFLTAGLSASADDLPMALLIAVVVDLLLTVPMLGTYWWRNQRQENVV